MLRINGTPVPTPDTMAFKYELPPGDLTPATASLLVIEAAWGVLMDEEVEDVLRTALGQCTLAVTAPATGEERTFAARLQQASLKKRYDGWHDAVVTIRELPGV